MKTKDFDKERFDTLYNRYSAMIYRAAYGCLQSRADAEDVVQDVFVTLFTKAVSFKDDEHQKAWLLKVTANRCKNLLRAKARTVELPDSAAAADFESESDAHIDLARALCELSPDQRLAMHLYYFEQIPLRGVAGIMRCGENTVKSHLRRARAKMKTFLEKEQKDDLQ